MEVLRRRALVAAFACATAAQAGCDLGLDPSMIDPSSSSTTTSSSSTGGGGGEAPTSGSTTTGAGGDGGSGGAGGEAGAGGAGGAGGEAPLVPCAPADDFANFVVNDPADGWTPFGDITAVTVDGNRKVRAYSLSQLDAGLRRGATSTLTSCFHSVRVEPMNNADKTYLSVVCGSSTTRFHLDRAARQARVEFTNPPATPPPLGTVTTPAIGSSILPIGYTLRVRFTSEVVFELKAQNASQFTVTHAFPRPLWMNECSVGFGVTDEGRCRFDDFCIDAP